MQKQRPDLSSMPSTSDVLLFMRSAFGLSDAKDMPPHLTLSGRKLFKEGRRVKFFNLEASELRHRYRNAWNVEDDYLQPRC